MSGNRPRVPSRPPSGGSSNGSATPPRPSSQPSSQPPSPNPEKKLQRKERRRSLTPGIPEKDEEKEVFGQYQPIMVTPHPLDFAIGTMLPSKRGAAAQLANFLPNEIDREKQIAKGSFGVVYVGKVRGVAEPVVIKDLQVCSNATFREWENEINVMRENNCQFITKIYGFCNNDPTLSLIIEHMNKGDLFGILHKNAHLHPLSTIQRLRMSRQVSFGLQYLHDASLMHRDMKSLNVLVTDDYSCKLADFGTAKLVAQHALLNTANTGSLLWMAPEVKRGVYSFPADVYSLGLVLYEILTGNLPEWDGIRCTVTLPAEFPWMMTILPCIEQIPEKRLTAENVSKSIDALIRKTIVTVREALNPQQKANLQEAHGDIPAQLDVIYKYFFSLPV